METKKPKLSDRQMVMMEHSEKELLIKLLDYNIIQTNALKSIKSWVSFFGWLTVLSIIFTIIALLLGLVGQTLIL